jgi:hypothetical protein
MSGRPPKGKLWRAPSCNLADALQYKNQLNMKVKKDNAGPPNQKNWSKALAAILKLWLPKDDTVRDIDSPFFLQKDPPLTVILYIFLLDFLIVKIWQSIPPKKKLYVYIAESNPPISIRFNFAMN